ncbi:glycosyltransferase family 32 protein [Coniophora puteana RWD-64-598 SS2]|uniref:Glycosyltransferase family 32 protein n=1 Tax=Coniophora puteana (strain RWD-64-598) TaxID=741705 RepID=A0A5M3MST3_CONPW|nr:glycosyltransferase family 32 protein [Coniophora puteana RWD-64-598 SS2]EIW82097.1 glycosyltransferase family 32 protein [Coniophora puteana RWD-64-598 SS2]
MARRRSLYIFLALLGLVLFGTAVVLSSVSYFLAINSAAYLTERDVPFLDNTTRWDASQHGQVERIPRIIHQTWKSETLPPRWKTISEACRDMMPDYEYMLWTDASSREFIAEHYPWFLDTYDDYEYTIQRADVIRYFVLHHFGGIYLDLDVGCLRPLDPLLVNHVILPKTIPVGVSNDLMFAEKGHPFLSQTIHNLVTFDHSWVLNYPTVMFSTGPMFLSAQYSLFTSSRPITVEDPGEVRILPKSLYGKNAKPEEAPHSFFAHFYGSSWHADDAAFIGFLAHWGKGLMWLGLIILVVGIYRLALPSKQRKNNLRRIGGYDVLLPRISQRNGRWAVDLRWSSFPPSAASTQPPSPTDSMPQSPIEDHVSLLPLPFDMRSASPAPSDMSSSIDIFPSLNSRTSSSVVDSARRVFDRAASFLGISRETLPLSRAPARPHRRQRSRGVMFFLPAIFTQEQAMELGPRSPPPQQGGRVLPPSSQLPPEKMRYAADLERAGLYRDEPALQPDGAQSSRPLLGSRSHSSSSASPLIDLEHDTQRDS